VDAGAARLGRRYRSRPIPGPLSCGIEAAGYHLMWSLPSQEFSGNKIYSQKKGYTPDIESRSMVQSRAAVSLLHPDSPTAAPARTDPGTFTDFLIFLLTVRFLYSIWSLSTPEMRPERHAAGRRPPKRSKRRNRRGTVRDRSASFAFRPAAAGRPSFVPPCAPSCAPLGLTAGPHPVRSSGSTLRFRRAILPPILPGGAIPCAVPGAVPGVDLRARSAGNLEYFLSKLFLRTSEWRFSNDSKGLGLPGAKKHIGTNVHSKSGRSPAPGPPGTPFRRGILGGGGARRKAERQVSALAVGPGRHRKISHLNCVKKYCLIAFPNDSAGFRRLAGLRIAKKISQ